MHQLEELQLILTVLESSTPHDDPISLAQWKLAKIMVNRMIRQLKYNITL